MKALAIILVILIVGYGVLGMYFRHECRKAKKERGEDDGSTQI